MNGKEKIKEEIEQCISDCKRIRTRSWVDAVMMLEDTFEHALKIIDSLSEEPVSEDLEEEINRYTDNAANYLEYGNGWEDSNDIEYIEKAARHFANWQKERMEKERLAHCDRLTKEQYEIESEFVAKHLEKNNRTPTFIDAIEYGMRLQKEQMMKGAKPADINYWNQRGLSIHFDESLERLGFEEDDKVKVIIIKEAEK